MNMYLIRVPYCVTRLLCTGNATSILLVWIWLGVTYPGISLRHCQQASGSLSTFVKFIFIIVLIIFYGVIKIFIIYIRCYSSLSLLLSSLTSWTSFFISSFLHPSTIMIKTTTQAFMTNKYQQKSWLLVIREKLIPELISTRRYNLTWKPLAFLLRDIATPVCVRIRGQETRSHVILSTHDLTWQRNTIREEEEKGKQTEVWVCVRL